MTTIKSIQAVRAYNNRNNGNWVARVRLQDGRELFAGLGAGYSLAQAQTLISNSASRPGAEFTESDVFADLPDGVKIKA